ncbi:MAG: hypothetical protein V1716_04190 [Candidatus Uhrbacteria bacterium]
MFDELKKPPEDIFASVDQSPVPPPFRNPVPSTGPTVPPIQPPPSNIATPPGMPSVGSEVKPAKTIAWKPIVLIALGAIVVIAAGAMLSRYILSSSKPVTESVNNLANTANTQVKTETIPTTPPVKTEVQTPVVEPVVEVDTDKDGLTDTREAELGTSPTSTDTDDDGLFDREEVEVYHTNPLSPDTDGDSYKDGDEVKSGYNPNGAGKLFELPVTEGE